jgi:germination protein M
MKTLVSFLAAAALAVLGAACGGDDGAVSAGPVPGTAGSPTEEATDVSSTEKSDAGGGTGEIEPAARRAYRVWFTAGETLASVSVDGPVVEGVAAQALELLLAGPPGSYGTAVPDGTRLLGVNLEDGVATVDLSSEFETGGGSLSMFLRLGQVVYTVTEFETVKAVRFHLDGEPVDVFSGEGIVLDEPVTREDYEDLLPIITVDSPSAGAAVSSPVRVSGTANVFEANVTVRVLGADGRELARTFTTASCGSGCWGTYSVDVPFEVAAAESGTIVVEDDDADGDGRPSHAVRIRVGLRP